MYRRGGGGAAAPAFTRQQAAERQELLPLNLNLGLRHHPSRDSEVEQEDLSSASSMEEERMADGQAEVQPLPDIPDISVARPGVHRVVWSNIS